MKPCPLCGNHGGSADTDDLFVGMFGPLIAHAGCGRCGLNVRVRVVDKLRQQAIDEAERRWNALPRLADVYRLPPRTESLARPRST